eukprot:g3173.t1
MLGYGGGGAPPSQGEPPIVGRFSGIPSAPAFDKSGNGSSDEALPPASSGNSLDNSKSKYIVKDDSNWGWSKHSGPFGPNKAAGSIAIVDVRERALKTLTASRNDSLVMYNGQTGEKVMQISEQSGFRGDHVKSHKGLQSCAFSTRGDWIVTLGRWAKGDDGRSLKLWKNDDKFRGGQGRRAAKDREVQKMGDFAKKAKESTSLLIHEWSIGGKLEKEKASVRPKVEFSIDDGLIDILVGEGKLRTLRRAQLIGTPASKHAPVFRYDPFTTLQLKSENAVTCHATTKTRDYIAMGAENGYVQILSGRLLPLGSIPAHEGPVKGLAFAKNKSVLVSSGGKDNLVKVWACKTGRMLAKMSGHQKGVNGVILLMNARLVLSYSNDSTIRLWNTGTGKEIHCISSHKAGK